MRLLYLALLIPMLAFGTDDRCEGNPHYCSGEGEQGPPGVDGIDGIDGIGIDGISAYQVAINNGFVGSEMDWITSLQGRDGVTGRDGVVDQSWINELHTFQGKYSHYLAASEALQIYLPQEQKSRLTFGVGRVHGATGLGIGYAYVNEEGVALTAGIGTSGSENVGKISAGFEFGGDRNHERLTAPSYKAQLECAYVGGELTLTNECVVAD